MAFQEVRGRLVGDMVRWQCPHCGQLNNAMMEFYTDLPKQTRPHVCTRCLKQVWVMPRSNV